MPHAEESKMPNAMVNGEQPSSRFVSVSSSPSPPSDGDPSTHLPRRESKTASTNTIPQHLTSYPVVSDGIRNFKSNPYGAKSVSLVHSASETFLQPVLPYARKPYSYVQPYVARADQLADAGLGQIDHRVPLIKEESKTVGQTLQHYALLPFAGAAQAKDYVFATWGNEYKRCGENGLVAGGKAAITTGIVVVSDVGNWVGDLLRQGKKEGQGFVKEKTGRQ